MDEMNLGQISALPSHTCK